MTLNGVIAIILCFFSPNSIPFQADYVTVVKDRGIMSVKYCLPVPVFYFWPKLTHPAARSLLIAELLGYKFYSLKIKYNPKKQNTKQTNKACLTTVNRESRRLNVSKKNFRKFASKLQLTFKRRKRLNASLAMQAQDFAQIKAEEGGASQRAGHVVSTAA